jgi:hypothetical protein
MQASRHGTVERALPYDPVEWSRRLDRAREMRARVLEARAAGRARAEKPPSAPVLRLTAQVAEEPPVLSLAVAARDAETPKPRPRRGFRLALGVTAGVAAGSIAALLAAAI